MLVPLPPIDVRSTDAKSEQAMTGSTTARLSPMSVEADATFEEVLEVVEVVVEVAAEDVEVWVVVVPVAVTSTHPFAKTAHCASKVAVMSGT
ncbi:unnamed protein product [Phytophthora lilii]|uniref:Unnamed protein product n=1 Tax=Phytophthora lilii TaxID=2077276 RepID=A0A9W6UEP2_9STRA|nr:unnamed protein product [Phytophthora lilii]